MGPHTSSRPVSSTNSHPGGGTPRNPHALGGRIGVVPRGRWTSPLALALLCGHCALGGLLALLSLLGLATAPVVFGVDMDYVWPPVLILGGFGLYLWSGRERESCEMPASRQP